MSGPTVGARQLLEGLESRRLFSYVQPAYADKLGFTGALNLNTTFEDNFEGTSLDASKWQVREGPRWRVTPGSSNIAYTTRDAIQVGNGALTLSVFNDPASGQLRSGWIQTGKTFSSEAPGTVRPGLADGYSGNFEQRYGYWEARLKINTLAGMWGGFWVHSYKMTQVQNDWTTANHPEIYGTEYDVAEHYSVRQGVATHGDYSAVTHANGYESLHISNGVHVNTYTKGPSYSSPADWHTYGLYWTPTSANFYLDGNLVYTETNPAMVSKIPHLVILSTETGAPGTIEPTDGSNFFGYVPAGGYGSRETTQAKLTVDYLRVWQLNSETVTPPPTTTTSVIEGSIFTDANGNGMKDGAETGRAGVNVYIDLNYNNQRDGNETQVVTDGTGAFRFGAAPASQGVAVRVNLLETGLTQTKPSGNGSLWLSTAAGQAYNAGTFGVRETVVTPPPATTATIRGNVYLDANSNGRRDTGEIGRAEVRVYLDTNFNSLRDADEVSALTDTAGAYRFDGVKPGVVAIRLDLSGTTLTQVTPAANASLWLATAAGLTYADQNFGVVAPVPAKLAVLAGSVFGDSNWNGRKDGSETGKSGVSVYLDANFNGAHDSGEPLVTTSSTGAFRFENVKPGATAVRLLLTGTSLTRTAPGGDGAVWVTAIAGVTTGEITFGVAGETTPATTNTGNTARGSVFYDFNKNGRKDAGEAAMTGVTIWADYDMDGVRDSNEPAALTNSTGAWVLENLKLGTYVLRVYTTNLWYTQSLPANNDGYWRTFGSKTVWNELIFGLKSR